MKDENDTYSRTEKLLRELGLPIVGRDAAEVARKRLRPTYSPGHFQVDRKELEGLARNDPAGGANIIIRLLEHIALLRQSELSQLESSEKYQLALKGADFGMWEWFPQTGLNLLDEGGHRILGYAPGEVAESTAGFENMVHPDDRPLVSDTMIEHLQGKVPIWSCEYRIITRSGTWKWLFARGKICEWDDQGNPWRVIGAFVDMTDRKLMEQRLETSLKEREALLREMHHRVKNNFASVIGLLRAQARRVTDSDLATLFKETEFRVRCMGFVHEKLHNSETLDSIRIRDYLVSLLESLEDTYRASLTGVAVKKDIQEVSLSVDTAIPLGFIASELCSNCFKHAFPEGGGGEVIIRLQPVGRSKFELVVGDNGIGLAEDIDLGNLQSLGLKLVQGFVRQIDGDLRFDRRHGTRACITFGRPA